VKSVRVLSLMVLVNALWAGKNFAVKLAQTEHMSPTTVSSFRWGFFAIILWGLLAIPGFRKASGAVMPKPKDAMRSFLIGLILFAPAHVLYYLSLNYTTTIEATVLHMTQPMITAGFAAFLLKEKVTPYRWVALTVCLVGAYVVLAGFALPQWSTGTTYGNLMYLAAVVVETLGIVLVARVILRSSGLGALAYQLIGMALGAVTAAIILPSPAGWQLGTLTTPVILAIAYLVIFASAVCFSIWYTLVKHAPLSLITLVMGLQPVLATGIGMKFFGEKGGSGFVPGSILVLVALVIGAFDPAHKEVSDPVET